MAFIFVLKVWIAHFLGSDLMSLWRQNVKLYLCTDMRLLSSYEWTRGRESLWLLGA